MSGSDHRYARGYKGSARQENLRKELAADVAAFLRQPGNAIERIPDGVSGLDDRGLPKGSGRRPKVKPQEIINNAVAARRRMDAARPRGDRR